MTKKVDKKLTRSKTQKAIRKGELIKIPCEVCGNIKVDCHHTDYRDHLSVMWLCHDHHMQWHRDNGYPQYEQRVGTTRERHEFGTIVVSEEALIKARKVAKNRKESVSQYVSSLILSEYNILKNL